ncbi:MAG: pilus assembly protein [Leucobacter sp.]
MGASIRRPDPAGDPRRIAAELLRDERGAVTAEFAIVLPAVVAVLALTIGGVLIASHRVALVSLAAQVARLEARGDADLAAEMLRERSGEVEVERTRRGGLHCVALRSHPGGGMLSRIGIEGLGCAAVSGEGPPDGSAGG